MTEDRMRGALQTIFSFFLGLMVLAFIAVGVNTFYQSPSERSQPQMQRLSRQIEQLNIKAGPSNLTAADRARMAELSAQQAALQATVDRQMRTWARNTSIVLVLFATIVMSVSLIRSDQLRVISNGLLLGGLFTMIYGAGWVIFSGTSAARFGVIGFALVVTVVLGYLKFVRDRTPAAAESVAATASAPSVTTLPADLEARLSALESRTAAAAAALAATTTPGAEATGGATSKV